MIPPGYVGEEDAFGSLSTCYRWRRRGVIPAPDLINGHRVYSVEQVEAFRRGGQRGEDCWMKVKHGRGRPAADDIAAFMPAGV